MVCAVALAGCSVLTGRTSTDATGSNRVRPSGSAAVHVLGPQFTSDKAARGALRAAQQDFETVFTYDYRNLGKYLSAGLKVTTSPYSSTYSSALQGKEGQKLVASKSVQVATSALSALASLTNHQTRAAVIVHGSLATTSANNPSGTMNSVTVVLNLHKVGRSWRIASTKTGAATQGAIPANPAMRKAMSAARSAVIRIYGLRRSHFQADYAKALALTTDDLHATMTTSEPALLKTLTTGKYDLSAKIVGFAAEQPAGDATFVVALDEYRVSRQNARLGPYHHQILVVATSVRGKWLLRSATPLS